MDIIRYSFDEFIKNLILRKYQIMYVEIEIPLKPSNIIHSS